VRRNGQHTDRLRKWRREKREEPKRAFLAGLLPLRRRRWRDDPKEFAWTNECFECRGRGQREGTTTARQPNARRRGRREEEEQRRKRRGSPALVSTLTTTALFELFVPFLTLPFPFRAEGGRSRAGLAGSQGRCAPFHGGVLGAMFTGKRVLKARAIESVLLLTHRTLNISVH
jgi:hypothetical protein